MLLDRDTFNFNLVRRARLKRDEAGAWIQRVLRFFCESGHPILWWVGPVDRPDDPGERLIAAGLQRAETELAMAADLAALSAQGRPLRHPGFGRNGMLARLRLCADHPLSARPASANVA